MEIAKVIVDVPVKQTDRPFDYLVPESMREWIEIGSRVGVPFGHRTVQGFVVDLVPRTGRRTLSSNPLRSCSTWFRLCPRTWWSLRNG